jgi:hypothetical protein
LGGFLWLLLAGDLVRDARWPVAGRMVDEELGLLVGAVKSKQRVIGLVALHLSGLSGRGNHPEVKLR